MPATDAELIELEDVIRFVERPCRAFLRQRLGISVRESLDEVEDALPVELDALERWGVGQRLLDGLLAGAELEECVRAELARGLAAARDARGTRARPGDADRHRDRRRGAGAGGTGPARSLDVNLRLPDGRTLAGTVPGFAGDTIRRASYSRVRPRDRLAAWVRLLALAAARPGESCGSAVIGRARPGRLPRRDDRRANRSARHRGGARASWRSSSISTTAGCATRSARLPGAAAYAGAAGRGEDGLAAALAVWETTFGYDKEDREPEHLLVYGGALPLHAS